MTTPGTALPRAVVSEITVDGGWQRLITAPEYSDVLQTEPIGIERGRADEQTDMPPCTLTAALINDNGKYTPDNPLSPLYGRLGLNTPVRHSLAMASDTYNRTVGAGWGTSDSGNVWAVVGADSSVGGGYGVHSLNGTNISISSYTGDPVLDAYLKVDYTPAFSDVTGGGIEPGNLLLRWVDVNNHYIVRITVVNSTDTFRIFAIRRKSAVETFIGVNEVDTGLAHIIGQKMSIVAAMEGRTLRVKIWSAASPEPYVWNFTATDEDDEAAIEQAGLWGVRSGVAGGNTNAKPIVFNYSGLEMRVLRVSGELTKLKPSWDVSHEYKTANMTMRGVLQRMGQGDAPVRSAMRRAYDGIASAYSIVRYAPVGYWPCEDGLRSDSIASGLANGNPMTYNGGPPDFAAYSNFACSAPMLMLNQADLTGEIPFHTSLAAYMSRFLLSVPSGGTVAGDVISRLYFHNASIWFADIQYHANGNLSVQAYDFNNTLLHNTGEIYVGNVNGKDMRIQLQFTQNGANVDWGLYGLAVAESLGWGSGGTWAGRIMGTAARIIKNPYRNIDSVAIGHIAVHKEVTSLFDYWEELKGFVGETTGARFLRLCNENGIDGVVWGNRDGTRMGAQRVANIVTLLRECADTEQGIMFEARSWSGLILRMRNTLYAQNPRLVLNYAAGQVAPELVAPHDDAGLRNDITAERTSGSSFRSYKEQGTGPKNAGRPWEDPEAVGPYTGRVTVNTELDSQLKDVADQALRIGTAPDTRYPQVSVDLAAEEIDTATMLKVLAVNIGDRIQVINAVDANIPNAIDQIVQGYSEDQPNQFLHRLTFNTTPYSPWNTIVLDQTLLDGDVNTFEALGTSETAIKATSYPNMDTDPTVFPYSVTVDGEEWTVSAVTDGATPQYISAGTAAHADNASVTPGLPGGASTTGDILVMHTACRDFAGVSTAPVGWTVRFNLGNMKVWTKVRGAAEAAPTVTIAGGAAGCTHSARIYALRGVPEIPVGSGNDFGGGVQNAPVPATSTSVQSNLTMWFVWKQNAWTSMATVEPNATVIGDDPTAVGSAQSIGTQYRISASGYNLQTNTIAITGGATSSIRTLVLIWGNPQVLTVARQVNQISKGHNAGALVLLTDQSSYLGR